MSVKLHNNEEFDKRFRELLKESATYQEAYQGVEVEYYQTFGHTKYANYESYRTSLAHRRRRKDVV